MTYRITRKADQDLVEVYLWGCREFGQPQADQYHEGLAGTFDLIADNPRIARERPEFNPPVRLHPYRRHLIVYVFDDPDVLILRILHGRSEWERRL